MDADNFIGFLHLIKNRKGISVEEGLIERTILYGRLRMNEVHEISES